MSAIASDIISRARTQLIDNGVSPRWTDTEMLKWLSDGQRAIVAISPSSTSTLGTKTLVTGTKQTAPADSFMFLGLTRNMGLDAATPGRACRIISREVLDAFDPDWHSGTPGSVVQSYIYDPQQLNTFYVWPPNDGTGSVEVSYSVLPTDLTLMSDGFQVVPIYQTALLDYLLYRCYQKDSDFSGGQALAALYLQSFTLFVTGSEGSQLNDNPNLQLTPPSAGSKATAK